MSSVFLPPEQTRLITIIAHVDHGKTTLADNLVESNGIISERLAGTIRYLDSMEEEQRRGITIRASAIGLRHKYITKSEQIETIHHLLDSPGHTDFSTEVSSSLQCCDGALLVVDAVEGMCARTHQVLREAHVHQLVPILVINKVDRLCTELCLSTTEAYVRLRGLIESVNAATAAMILSKNADIEDDQGVANGAMDDEESRWTFEPGKGNVIFASALFGWGFSIPALARSLFRGKILPMKPPILRQCLFGDFKYANGKVLKWKQDGEGEPMFAEFALRQIWDIYEGVSAASQACGLGTDLFANAGAVSNNAKQSRGNDSKIKVTTPGMSQVIFAMQSGSTATSIQCPKSEAEIQQTLDKIGSSTEEPVLRALLRRYRPVSDVILDSAYEIFPSPANASSIIRPRALALANDPDADGDSGFRKIKQAVKECIRDDDAPVIAHVCKFMATDRNHIRDPDLGESDATVIMGLARVLSGRLRTGDAYYVFGPKHRFANASLVPRKEVRLYLLMGSSYVRVSEVPAGHLCAIQNLDELQLKTATLCDSPRSMPLQGFDLGVQPLVKVNVESESPADSDILSRGLLKLSLADAAVDVTLTAQGERILACLGEIHLEQSINDLQKIYCEKEIRLRISDPIVAFGETTDWFPNEMEYQMFYDADERPLRHTTLPPYNEEEGLENARMGRSRALISGRVGAIHLRVVPLASSIYGALKSGKADEKGFEEIEELGKALGLESVSNTEILDVLSSSLLATDMQGNAIVQSVGLSDGQAVVGVQTTNSQVFDPNMMSQAAGEHVSRESAMNGLSEYERCKLSISKGFFGKGEQVDESEGLDGIARRIWQQDMRGSVPAGFNNAVRAGAICEEPIRGVLVVLEGVEVALVQKEGSGWESKSHISGGMVVAALRSGIRSALLTRPVRLMESHLRLTLHSALSGLGPLYSVLSKRRGKVIDDAMVEGTDLIRISATLPHAESFGLTSELFRKSSGEVTAPELVFSHWARFDEDPFWIPTSLEEREDFGEISQNGDASTGVDNTALNYIRLVRKRKGLLVDSSRTVVAAEKQRTLKK